MNIFQSGEELFHSALALPPDQRAAFLDQATQDAAIRLEVQSLLEAHAGECLLDTSPISGSAQAGLPAHQALSAGQIIAGFEIVDLIGHGGMGEVYRARDLKLQRDVALKVMRADFLDSPDRRSRFEREARAASALNHPTICTIYGITEHAGHPVLVMELLDGETLAARLRRGALPSREAIDLGVQLSTALDTAHSKGIVHRDLKPANIMLTPNGLKVLDFGIAKRLNPAGGAEGSHTETGAMLGTLQYASPEQLQGLDVDRRSDIFSFGVVLYETVMGRTPLQAPDTIDPLTLDRIVKTCLATRPADRFQSARDLTRALEWLREPRLPAGGARGKWVYAAALAALAGLLTAAGWFRPRPTEPAPMANWTFPLPGTEGARAFGHEFVLSPDGSAIAFFDAKRWPMLEFAGGVAQPLTTREQGRYPFWSPDGKSVAFFSNDEGVLLKMAVPGGLPQELCRVPLSGGRRGGTWSAKGTIIYSSAGNLFQVPASGGAPSRLQIPGIDITRGECVWPQFLPDGEDFLFALAPYTDENADLYLTTLRNGKVAGPPALLRRNATSGQFSPAGGGQLLFIENDTLFAQKIDLGARKLVGDPRRVQDGVRSDPGMRLPEFSVSSTGFLGWRSGRARLSQVTWFDRTGKVKALTGEPRLANRLFPALDGSHLLVEYMDTAALCDRNQPGFTKLPAPAAIWDRQEATLLYTNRLSDGNFQVLRLALNSPGGPSEILRLKDVDDLDAVSPDGRFLLYLANGKLYSVQVTDGPDRGQPHLAVHTDEYCFRGNFSPDGRWIVYTTRRRDSEVYIQRFGAPSIRTQIAEGASFPVWRADGKEIVCLRGDQVISIRLSEAGGRMQASPPEVLFSARSSTSAIFRDAPLALSADGSQIIVAVPVEQPADGLIHLSTAWYR